MSRITLFVAAAALLLNGCGGSGGGGGNTEPAAPQPVQNPPLPFKLWLAVPDGAWEGTTTDSLGNQKAVRAFVIDRNSLQVEIGPKLSGGSGLVNPATWVLASVEQCCAFETAVVASTNTYDNSGARTARVTASFMNAVLGLTVEHGNERYEVALQRDTSEPKTISPLRLSGTYAGFYSSYRDRPKAWTLTIEEQGRVTGSDDYGCTWSGTAATTTSSVNGFKMTLDASGCVSSADPGAPSSGRYVAMGHVSDASPTRTRYPGQPVIDFSIAGPVWIGSQMLAR